jgi:hypothetical protein
LPKYYYKPLEESVETTRLEASFATGEYNNSVLVVVDAPDQEEAYQLGKAIINFNDWELSHVENEG